MILKTTPLIEEHRKNGAKFINFHQWKMPLEFQTGAKKEHLNVRSHAGLFDISYMHPIRIRGDGALSTLEKLLTNNPHTLTSGKAQYSLLCQADGGIIDDVIVYCFKVQKDYLLISNAPRGQIVLNWMAKHNPPGGGKITDESSTYAFIALQGPTTYSVLKDVLGAEQIKDVSMFQGQFCDFQHSLIWVAGTGYTGEKGVEILAPVSIIKHLWQALLHQGEIHGVKPAGLAARDTLRLEMKYPLYGADLTTKVNPLSAGLAWVVKNPAPFIGATALSKIVVKKKWVGFCILASSGGVPRKGQSIWHDKAKIGEVTSGALSPSLNKMIGTGFVDTKYSKPGQILQIAIHNTQNPAEVVVTPFIKK